MKRFLALTGLSLSSLCAETYTWNNGTANWSTPSSWFGGIAPAGANFADELTFGGAVAPDLTPAVSPPAYTATNDFSPVFDINRLTLTATDPLSGGTPGIAHVINGGALSLIGGSPQIAQNGAGAINFQLPVKLGGDLIFTGDGAGSVTLNRGLSGFADLTKNGASTFRFGTFPPPPIPPATTSSVPSENTWVGALRLNAGIFRFNNNIDSGRTALRANAVVFPASASGTPTLSCTSELRTGTLSGTVGKAESSPTGTNLDSNNIVLSALADGSFGGIVRLGPPTGTGSDAGTFVVRGPGTQTLTGILDIDKDVEVAGSMVLAGAASLGTQTKGAVLLSGGTLRIDNTTTANPNRLRDASGTSTGIDLNGGGTFILDGNPAGSSETIGRLQLAAQTGSTTLKTKQRSGHLRMIVQHRAGAAAASQLTVQSYERDATTLQPLNTVEFSATNGAGTTLNLGSSGSNPRIVFATAPTLTNSIFNNNTGSVGTGWATVKTTGGLAFATHGATGVAAVTTTATWASNAAANVLITGTQAVNAATFSLNSLRIVPSAVGLTLSIPSGQTLNTTGIILAGANDYAIGGVGTLGGTAPRYVHVEQATLTIAASLGNAQPLVKSGDGLLLLTNTGNSANQQIFALNGGLSRTTSGTTLPGGEIRFRGGVLELTGGGTFNRPLLTGAVGSEISGPGTVNWNTVEMLGTIPSPTKVPNDRGSGGFAAIGADMTIDLGAAGATALAWEQKGFVQSGFVLVFGSRNATARVTLVDDLNLTSGDATINYNAREIRVDDNAASTADRAVLSGLISGTIHNDLLKTGAGILELSGANTFGGLAIVQAGTLVVSGSASNAIGVQVMTGATLAGSGNVSEVLLESGGKVSPGDGGAGTLTASGLTWKAGGICRFDLGGDRLALGTGALTKRSAGSFAFDFGGTGAANQIYTLATFGSTGFSRTDFTALNAGASGVFRFIGSTLVYDTNPLSAIQQWRLANFGTPDNAGAAADTSDTDSDGLVNLLEYGLGTSPLVPNVSGIQTGRSANRLTLTFSRNASATDITFAIEAGSDLTPASWITIATSNIAGSWTPAIGVTVNETAGTVVITDSSDMLTIPKRFVRLRFTRP